MCENHKTFSKHVALDKYSEWNGIEYRNRHARLLTRNGSRNRFIITMLVQFIKFTMAKMVPIPVKLAEEVCNFIKMMIVLTNNTKLRKYYFYNRLEFKNTSVQLKI